VSSRNRGDVTIVEIDRLVQPPAQGGGEPGKHLLTRDLALLDLRNASLGKANWGWN
jgi:hypothetical protein